MIREGMAEKGGYATDPLTEYSYTAYYYYELDYVVEFLF